MTARFCRGLQSHPRGMRFMYAQSLVNSGGITHVCACLQISGPGIPCANTYKQESGIITRSWKSVAAASGKIGVLRLQPQRAGSVHTVQAGGLG